MKITVKHRETIFTIEQAEDFSTHSIIEIIEAIGQEIRNL